MKKDIVLVLSLALLLTISACSKSEGELPRNSDVEHTDIEKSEQAESNDQPARETETSGEEEVKEPEEEAVAIGESEEIAEPNENKNSPQLYAMYYNELMMISTYRIGPNDKYFNDGGRGEDFSQNNFAVIDIDGDGRDELIFSFCFTDIGDMEEVIYDYDEKNNIFRTELEDIFVGTTYYHNGYVKVEASHNHTCDPETKGVWPYSVYKYDTETDSYKYLGNVGSWDGLTYPTNHYDEAFPDELDKDKDNLLFYVDYSDTSINKADHTYMDREEFEVWEQTMFPDEYIINIEYHPMTEEEITLLIGIKSQNSVNGSEFALNNANDGLEEIKKIREYMIPEQSFDVSLNDWGEVTFVSCMPMPDSDGYTDPHADVSFYLVSGEQIIYRFPYVNYREGTIASPGVSFVMFTDVNEDGKDDVVIGILYFDVGYMQQNDPLMEIRVYIDNGDEFVHDKSQFDESSGLDYDTTAEEVKAMLKK